MNNAELFESWTCHQGAIRFEPNGDHRCSAWCDGRDGICFFARKLESLESKISVRRVPDISQRASQFFRTGMNELLDVSAANTLIFVEDGIREHRYGLAGTGAR